MKKWNGLKKELKSAKKNRNIKIKEIIFECECSKPHFDKVISGKRKPGKDLIKKLSKSLGISEKYINELLLYKEVTSNKSRSKNNILKYVKLYIIVILVFILVWLFFRGYFFNKKINIPTAPIKLAPRILGDSSNFVKDVTIPDGSYIFINTSFRKIWRIKNTGSIPWEDRYLMRVTPFNSLTCHSDSMIPIKDTLPQEEVDIAINFTSMKLPGSCRTDWKMVDRFQSPFFLNKHGLYLIVNITNDKSLVSNKSP
jgi:transcriptional regulator with XRE-family HTH domain